MRYNMFCLYRKPVSYLICKCKVKFDTKNLILKHAINESHPRQVGYVILSYVIILNCMYFGPVAIYYK